MVELSIGDFDIRATSHTITTQEKPTQTKIHISVGNEYCFRCGQMEHERRFLRYWTNSHFIEAYFCIPESQGCYSQTKEWYKWETLGLLADKITKETFHRAFKSFQSHFNPPVDIEELCEMLKVNVESDYFYKRFNAPFGSKEDYYHRKDCCWGMLLDNIERIQSLESYVHRY